MLRPHRTPHWRECGRRLWRRNSRARGGAAIARGGGAFERAKGKRAGSGVGGVAAGLAEGPEQAAELYLASRLAIDPDHPMEQAYLVALASRFDLPRELVEHLEDQAAKASAA